MPNMSKQYQLILGTFIDNEFIWHDVDSYDTIEEAYREYKKYVNSQLKYTDEELSKVWNTGRLDIELRRGNKLLNWVGIYAREVDKLSEDEEEKANKDNPENKEKKSTKDDSDPIARGEDPLELAMEEEGEPEDDHNLRVCEHCLMGIEAHEGKQFTRLIEADDDQDCEWCGDHFEYLYELL